MKDFGLIYNADSFDMSYLEEVLFKRKKTAQYYCNSILFVILGA